MWAVLVLAGFEPQSGIAEYAIARDRRCAHEVVPAKAGSAFTRVFDALWAGTTQRVRAQILLLSIMLRWLGFEADRWAGFAA
jgi:hypothetical protein